MMIKHGMCDFKQFRVFFIMLCINVQFQLQKVDVCVGQAGQIFVKEIFVLYINYKICYDCV